MSTILNFPKANPIRIVPTQMTGKNFNNKDNKLFHEWSQPYDIRSYTIPFQNSDRIFLQFDSSFDSDNVVEVYDIAGTLILSSTIVDPVEFEDGEPVNFQDDVVAEYEGSLEAITSIVRDFTTFQRRQVYINPTAFDPGIYYLKFTGLDADTNTYTAYSEYFEIKSSWCNTILCKYYNNEPAFGIDYRSGVVMQSRMRAFFHEDADENDFENFINSLQSGTKIFDYTIEGRVLRFWDLIPSWVGKQVNLILAHDYVDIEDLVLVGGEKMSLEPIGIRKHWLTEAKAELRVQSNDLINRHDSTSRILFG